VNKTEAYGYKTNAQKKNKGNSWPPGCWAPFLAVVWVVGPLNQAFAGGRQENIVSPSVGITLRLYNQAQVPAKILQGAEHDVMRLFRSAGVNTNFVDCPMTREPGPSYLACQEAAGSGFVLKIVSLGVVKTFPAPTDAFGLTLPCGPREAACTAYIFYDRAREFAPSARIDPAVVLGRVLCHELGHLLGLVHSEIGLMRADWNPTDFDLRNLSRMAFTPSECQRIQAQAAARTAGGRQITAKPRPL
jgi:hypothetical protein